MSRSPQWLVPDWPDAPDNVAVLCTTRRGGVSPAPYDDGQGAGGLNLGTHVGDAPKCVERNRDILRSELPCEPVWLSQVHGIGVVDADQIGLDELPVADASYARRHGTVCAIMTADCLPVLFTDTAGTIVAGAHAGWRSLANGVLEQTVRTMREQGAGEIVAWLGVAIGPYKFEVSEDVRQAFLAREQGDAAALDAAFNPQGAGKYLADIYALARVALRRVDVARVSGGEYCTVSNSGRFYSYRRDGVTGRQASLIWLK
jgi:YfiH family protein